MKGTPSMSNEVKAAEVEQLKKGPQGVAELQGALQAAKVLFDRNARVQAAVAPIVKHLEFIEREITRTHDLITVKLNAREFVSTDQTHLQLLREKFLDALEIYQRKAQAAQDELSRSVGSV
jgi:hypothetical protein